jgi:hypothetical protein
MRWTRVALPGLAGLLGVVLAAELLAGPEMAGPQRLGHVPAARSGAAAHEPVVAHWAETALARPLFSADRRPPQDDKATTGLARLTAIVIAGGSRRAIFAADGQKPRIVPEGGEIGGYKLLHITGDSVQLGGTDGTLTLHPKFNVVVPQHPPTPPAPPPSAADYDNES